MGLVFHKLHVIDLLIDLRIYLFIVFYDSANKQKQCKKPSRNKETNVQWRIE